MGYTVCRLQNDPDRSKATIVILEGSPEWDEALVEWKDGKNPTDSHLWRKGVIACTRLVDSSLVGARMVNS